MHKEGADKKGSSWIDSAKGAHSEANFQFKDNQVDHSLDKRSLCILVLSQYSFKIKSSSQSSNFAITNFGG